jgi:DNA primase
VLLQKGFKVHVVTFPEGEDPDTFVSQHGRDKLEAQLGNAIDVFERKLQILQRGGWFSDLRRKRVALDRLLPTIRAASDAITRGLYLARAAEVVGVSEDVLQRELRQPRSRRDERELSEAVEEPAVPEERVRRGDRRQAGTEGMSAERELVRLLLHRRQHIEGVAETVGAESFREPRLGQIFEQLVAHPDDSIESLVMSLDDDAVATINDLSSTDGGLDQPLRIIRDCVAVLRRRELGEAIDAIDRQMPLADDAEKDNLVRRKAQLTREIKALGGGRWAALGRSRQ